MPHSRIKNCMGTLKVRWIPNPACFLWCCCRRCNVVPDFGRYQNTRGQNIPSRDARPKSIPAFYIKRKIHQLHLAIHARNAECIGKMNVFRKTLRATVKAAAMPRKITNICCFWVTATALVPPLTVYKTTRLPVMMLSAVRFQPRWWKVWSKGINGDTCPSPRWIKTKLKSVPWCFVKTVFEVFRRAVKIFAGGRWE